ncbi:MAG: hypothetical protein WAZ94_10065 [Phycisphaerales bacterium]
MDVDTLASFTQLGTAGLIGWMWLSERRAAAERERQLTELHERLLQERRGLEVAVEALRDVVRVLTTVEASQRALAGAIERLGARAA